MCSFAAIEEDMLNLNERIVAFTKLGSVLNELLSQKYTLPLAEAYKNRFQEDLIRAKHHNGWFDERECKRALHGIASWLSEEALIGWIDQYPELQRKKEAKTIALIMAGNIPLVGFHDILCVLISGNKVVGKISTKDAILPVFIQTLLFDIEPRFNGFLQLSDSKIESPDAVIATGSNNSGRYFEYYFGKYPHIIRKNRNSVAVINGNESNENLKKLGEDIFAYFGQGCRNVSKLFIPKEFEISRFFEAIVDYNFVCENKKYMNNYEYHKTLFLLNNEKDMLDNNFLLLRTNNSLSSPIGCLHIQKYNHKATLEEDFRQNKDKIQCIVGNDYIPFGNSQSPKLTDYADDIDTIAFLLQL
jgi:hypothetical protein